MAKDQFNDNFSDSIGGNSQDGIGVGSNNNDHSSVGDQAGAGNSGSSTIGSNDLSGIGSNNQSGGHDAGPQNGLGSQNQNNSDSHGNGGGGQHDEGSHDGNHDNGHTPDPNAGSNADGLNHLGENNPGDDLKAGAENGGNHPGRDSGKEPGAGKSPDKQPGGANGAHNPNGGLDKGQNDSLQREGLNGMGRPANAAAGMSGGLNSDLGKKGLGAAAKGLHDPSAANDPMNGSPAGQNGSGQGQNKGDGTGSPNQNVGNLNPTLNDNLDPTKKSDEDKDNASANPLSKAASGLSGAAKSLGGKARGAYGKVLGATTTGVTKMSSKLHIPIKPKAAKLVSKILLTSALGGIGVGVYMYENQNKPLDTSQVCATQNNGDQSYSGDDDSTGSGGDWQKKGTKAYKNAETIWNFWKAKGLSGAAISGILGNIAHEGGFAIIDRAEGHMGSSESANGISAGNVPAGGAGYTVGGGGIYQFTPYTKYAPLKSKKWLDLDAMNKFVWTSEMAHASWKTSYAKSSSPAEAAKSWFDDYERGASFDSKKATDASNAYKLFHGDSVKFDASLLGGGDQNTADDNAASAEKTNDALCNNESNPGGDTSSVLKTAESLVGYFTYSQPTRTQIAKSGNYQDIKSLSDVKKSGTTDCSGFVWLVLKLSGYKVPSAMWATPAMESDAAGSHKYLKKISESETQAGDIVIVNKNSGNSNDGHTAVLAEKFHGNPGSQTNSTKIIQEGGMDKGPVNKAKFGESFYPSLLGGRVTFARPIKK